MRLTARRTHARRRLTAEQSGGPRFGRRPALVLGLAGFATASGVAALVDSVEALIALRVVMGVSAALIFPTTLSIIANAYTERRERATALGI